MASLTHPSGLCRFPRLRLDQLPPRRRSRPLNDLKREYDRASQVILSRTSRLPRIWTCFSTLHKDDRVTIMDNGREKSVPLIPRSTLAQCRGTVPDGQWKFRADDYRNPETGKLESIVCCGSLCISAYMSNRPVGGLSRR